MKLLYTLPLLASFVAVSGCSDTTDFNFDTNREAAAADVDPPAVPFPSALLFAGSDDATLNIPLGPDDDPTDFSNPLVALNTLDGFSTTQPFTASFSTALDATTLIPGESVRLFEVITDSLTGAVIGVIAEVPAQTYVVALASETTLAVQTLVPLVESRDYMVVVTNDALDVTGAPAVNSIFRLTSGQLSLAPEPVQPDTDAEGAEVQQEPVDPTFANLEPIRQLNNAMLQVAASVGIERNSVVQIWSLKTQSITPVMQSIKGAAEPAVIAVQPTGASTSDAVAALPGRADIYAGALDIPYYLAPPRGPNDPAGISSFFRGPEGSFLTRFNSVPIATSVQTIPVLMTVPNASSGQTMPEAGWPVAIFVHGITRNRTDMVLIADAMALAGYAVIAIDQPMHGITDTTDPSYSGFERTFDLDLIDNTTSAPGPDGVIDGSGAHFFSPARLLTTRDNLRQSASDLLVLSASIENISAVPLDASRKALIGYSLGGVASTLFAAFDDTLSSVTLAMPAAGLVPMTLASPAFRDPLLAGLSAAGLEPGTADFNQFVVTAQTIIDAGDPINFGAQTAELHQVHMMEVLDDQTVLNSVEGALFSGSSPLARVMSLPPVTENTNATEDSNASGIVRFSEGDHASLLDPTASVATFLEMQSQIATFAASGGTLIRISDPSVILPVEQ